YYGEQAMGHVVQTGGLAVQNFLSAAVGMAVAVALVRGFARTRTGELGNFWADLVRGTVRILLPIALVGAILLVACGAIQNFAGIHEVGQFMGGSQQWNGGAVASQEAIKELGTNGGGYFNANSAHPFENPNGLSNLLEIFLILLIPLSLTRTFGRMVGSVRQGYAILAAMVTIWVVFTGLMMWTEFRHGAPAFDIAGGAFEGKETRFGIGASSIFSVATTLTSTGAVNSFLSSYTGFGGGIAMLGMQLGEIAPGGVGSGLYGILVMAVIAVFLAGLMVGRTPEYLGKKIGTRQIKFAACYILITPALVLCFTGVAMALPTPVNSLTNSGAHGFSEILYAYTSGANNNGSAFAGLNADTQWFNTSIGVAMLLGRFLPMVFVLALAGSLAEQKPVPATAGTLRTDKPLFSGLLVGTIMIVAGLTYFPALALGPLAEGLAS
ncbi:potassium-transporting ATPase subunit KdpA, partial [Streptomyces niveus]|uniref:potassium-transporting ATPase subunit KdpA n=1 Tax=Streptomyces niveus TaxID=193462 RepID=UPI003662C76A